MAFMGAASETREFHKIARAPEQHAVEQYPHAKRLWLSATTTRDPLALEPTAHAALDKSRYGVRADTAGSTSTSVFAQHVLWNHDYHQSRRDDRERNPILVFSSPGSGFLVSGDDKIQQVSYFRP